MDATRPKYEPAQLVQRPGNGASRAQDCRQAQMDEVDKIEQCARARFTAAKTIDIIDASDENARTCPRGVEIMDDEEKGMKRELGVTLAEDTGGKDLIKAEGDAARDAAATDSQQAHGDAA